jgi:hypothetical protein
VIARRDLEATAKLIDPFRHAGDVNAGATVRHVLDHGVWDAGAPIFDFQYEDLRVTPQPDASGLGSRPHNSTARLL